MLKNTTRTECLIDESIDLDMKKEYTVGLRGARTGDPDLDKTLMSIHAHMTLSGLGRQTKKIDGSLLAFIASLLPLKVRVIGEDLFGPKRTIHVVKLEIMDVEKRTVLTELIRQHGRPLDWQIRQKLGLSPEKKIPKLSRRVRDSLMDDPAFHMTIWEDDIRRRVIEVGEFCFTQVFLKETGDCHPVVMIDVDACTIKITKDGQTYIFGKQFLHPERTQFYRTLVPSPTVGTCTA